MNEPKWTDEDLPFTEIGTGGLAAYYAMSEDDAMDAANPLQEITRRERAHELLGLHLQFSESKDCSIIPHALYSCAMGDFPMPRWLAKAYILAYRNVHLYHDADKWDEVFGRPHPKGSQRSARQKKRKFQWAVYQRIQEIKNNDPNTAIDGHLFETVGREFGIGGKTLTEEYYYAEKKMSAHWRRQKPYRRMLERWKQE